MAQRDRPFHKSYIDWAVRKDRAEKKIKDLKKYDAANCEKQEIKTEIKKLKGAILSYSKKLDNICQAKIVQIRSESMQREYDARRNT